MSELRELDTDEINVVMGGLVAIPVDHYGFDMRTGQLVAYDKDGNIIDETVLR